MKYLIVLFINMCLMCLATGMHAQTDQTKMKSSKYETVELQVKGVCGMCKTRIEQAVYDLKGVKSAEWDLDSEVLTAVIRPKKVSRKAIAERLALRGHSSELLKADSTAYSALPECCKYDDGVRKHGGGH